MAETAIVALVLFGWWLTGAASIAAYLIWSTDRLNRKYPNQRPDPLLTVGDLIPMTLFGCAGLLASASVAAGALAIIVSEGRLSRKVLIPGRRRASR